MKILVTGGAGFIGSHLCEALLKKGEEVIIIDDFNDFYNPKLKEQNINKIKTKVRLYRTDIRNASELNVIVKKEKPEKIVHLAARAGVRPSMENPNLYEEVNVKGTLNLLEAARTNNVRQFIFGSSSSVYGIRNNGPFSEEEKTDSQISVYGATKKAGEVLCHSYAHAYRLPTTCLRFFTVYGPRQRPDLAIHKFTRLIMENQEVPMFGDGTTMRDYTYVGDIVDGILKALTKEFPYEIINLGNNKPITLKVLISHIEKATGKKAKVKKLPDQLGDVPLTYANISKAKNLLGWKPETPFEEGLKRFVEWFKENREMFSSSPKP